MQSGRVAFSRASAFVIALAVAGELAIEVNVSTAAFHGDLGAALRRLIAYFTVLTNLVVGVHFLAIAVGWKASGARVAGMVLWISIVCAVYHLVLSDTWSPQGLAWWSDLGLHTVTPVLVTLWWLAFASPWRPDTRAVLKWMVWPVGYLVYAVLRGALTGFWPYPFLDPEVSGVVGLMINILGVTLVFLGVGSGIAVFDAWRFGRAQPDDNAQSARR